MTEPEADSNLNGRGINGNGIKEEENSEEIIQLSDLEGSKKSTPKIQTNNSADKQSPYAAISIRPATSEEAKEQLKFNFDNWCHENLLNEETKEVLKEKGYSTEYSLLAVEADDIKSMRLPKGQERLLQLAIDKLKVDLRGSKAAKQKDQADMKSKEKDQQGTLTTGLGVHSSLGISNINLLRVIIEDFDSSSGVYWFLVITLIAALILQVAVAALTHYKTILLREKRFVKAYKTSKKVAFLSLILGLCSLFIFGFSSSVVS